MNPSTKCVIIFVVLATILNESLSAPRIEEFETIEKGHEDDYHCEKCYHWNGSRCVHPHCYPGTYWNGAKCAKCVGEVGACVEGHFWNGHECDHGDGHNCQKGYYWDGKRCVCKASRK